MRNSEGSIVFGLLLAAGLVTLVLALAPRVWLLYMGHVLQASQPAGVPQLATTPISGVAIATPSAGRVGEEVIAGKVAIRVTGVARPANPQVAEASTFQTLERGEEYLVVDISVRCLAVGEACQLTEYDFGVRSAAGRETPAAFTSRTSRLQLFEGGTIASGQSMSGALLFVVRQDDRGLVLHYPRMFSWGGSAEVALGR